MTTPETESNNLGQRHEHVRPARFSKEVRLPLAIRKELLITRAALERYDAAQALQHVRGGARRMTSLGTWLPRLTQAPGWLKLMGLTREYPMVSTAITLALPLLRRTPIGRIAWKLSKASALAGAGYWAFKVLKKSQRPAANSSPESKPADTGFRDPLVQSPPETSTQPQP
jgi:hypothetical protein